MADIITVERSLEMFPEEIFNKDFQGNLTEVYIDLMRAIARVKNPISRFTTRWDIIYQLSFFRDDNFSMAFVDPNDFMNGMIHVVPLQEPCLNHDELMKSDELIAMPAGVQAVSFKHFERSIKFIDIKRQDLILKYLRCDPIMLCEATKRFPQSGLLVVEMNKIFNVPHILKPSSSQFPKLVNFSRKLKKMIAEVDRYEK